ncbi:putative immunoglobulin domain protein [uncultured Mediterranean phage uvMED]|jgi:hypothetical protein|nr:putative immunoglobulin domain protein [uncultured Mediterranean phage uvMED]BAR17854.1 putative immunoglobulin domain protein [uncultured Mediterranean phage uvMED]|tara:strand:+ start:122 stop:451 length:330 start_codon:yes stop_codon:yes gene_type:complete
MAHTYKNSKVDLTTTNATALITVATGTTVIVKSIIICEDSNNDDSISLTIVNGSDTFQFLKDATVGAKSTIQGMGGHNATLVLGASDILKAQAATANRLHVITSYLEVT